MKKPFLIIAVLLVLIIGAAVLQSSGFFAPSEKLYVAVEGDSKIVVIDSAKRTLIRDIDLSVEHEGGRLTFAPHNIQVAPDGKSVWVTANAGSHQGAHSRGFINAAYAHGEEEKGSAPDEIVIINPNNDRIIKRIPVATGIHLAHVVLTPKSDYAYITAQKESVIYKVNARTYEVEKEIAAPEGSEPHGIRIAPDGSVAYIAVLEGKALGILDLATDALSLTPLDGKAVQAGVTPDGKYAFASLYDKKALALYDVSAKTVKNISLLDGARGPIQMYPTPDSQFVYLADQGYYFGAQMNEKVYKIHIKDSAVVADIKTGSAPHGVVVSKDGKFVYVTNLLSNDVAVIDTSSDAVVGYIAVGKEPNGISIWSKTSGGTP